MKTALPAIFLAENLQSPVRSNLSVNSATFPLRSPLWVRWYFFRRILFLILSECEVLRLGFGAIIEIKAH